TGVTAFLPHACYRALGCLRCPGFRVAIVHHVACVGRDGYASLYDLVCLPRQSAASQAETRRPAGSQESGPAAGRCASRIRVTRKPGAIGGPAVLAGSRTRNSTRGFWRSTRFGGLWIDACRTADPQDGAAGAVEHKTAVCRARGHLRI